MEDLSKVIVQEEFSYGPHDLQSLTVYNPVGSSHNEDGYFLIYIHGGAWRDPLITPSSILPTLTTLLSSPIPSAFSLHIRAVASLSYRLSPHPSFPQPPPPATPTSSYRSAIHPAHILDVLSGIILLQEKYGFGSRYILAGHSCGATLAIQTLMRSHLNLLASPSLQPELEAVKAFVEPEVIVGVAGIYDLKLLRDNNSHPAYQEFVSAAFGEDEKVWDKVSPALASSLSWKGGKLLVLATSSGDELVDPPQINVMGETARKWEGSAKLEVWKGMLDMSHDEIYNGGKGLAAVIERTLSVFFS